MKQLKPVKNWVQIVLTVLLVGAAFAIGSMWTELRLLKGKGGVANNQADQAQASSQPAPEEKTQLTDEEWKAVLENPAATLGSEAAKVTMVEFTDYQCPFCKRYIDDTFTQIKKDYVDAGKVKYLVRDYPLPFHANAHAAAEAARCAGDQAKYLAMHTQLFATQDVWSSITDPTQTFSGYAGKLGMNASKFTQCLKSGDKKAIVDADIALGGKSGVGGTPSFIINGKVLVGAQPYSAFKTAIDAALQQ